MKAILLTTAVALLIGSAMISMTYAGASCCATGNSTGSVQSNSFLPAPRTYAPPQANQATVKYTNAPAPRSAQRSLPVQVKGPVANPLPSCCTVPNGYAPVQAGAVNAPAAAFGGCAGACGGGCGGGAFTGYQQVRNPVGYNASPIRNVVTPPPTAQKGYTTGVTRRYW